jgi:D-glycero-D-manno-heptose 1,7-bisphosphate phosphatase
MARHAISAESQIRWVFLDRDGTLNVKPPVGEYIDHPRALRLMPRAGEALGMLNRAGIWAGVVTNQRGVALGRMSDAELAAVHFRLGRLLAKEDAALDAIYSCTHDVGVCSCRKPEGGMFLQAKRDAPELDFKRAAIVGDSLNDIEAGRRLGLTTVLLCPAGQDHEAIAIADHVAPDLLQAALLLTRL